MSRSTALLAAAAVVLTAAFAMPAQQGPATAVYLVRHAEKAAEPAPAR